MPSPASSPVDVQRFTDTVDRLFDRERIESFWDLQDAFRDLVATTYPAEVMNAELRRMVSSPSYMGEWLPNQLLIHRGRGFALSLWLFESSRHYVHSMPFLAMYAPVGAEPLSYTRYEFPADYRNEAFNPGVRIHSPMPGAVSPGEVLKLQTDRYLYDFEIEAPVPVVKLTTAPFESMEWLFNRESGYAWQANDGELKATQLRVAAYILGKLADPSSVDALVQLSEHPHHAVRWAAVQGIGRINRSVAIDKLEKSLTDPHPHIRRAAAKTLAQLKGG